MDTPNPLNEVVLPQPVVGALPVRVEDARAGPPAVVDGRDGAPDDAVGDGDEGIIYNHGWV